MHRRVPRNRSSVCRCYRYPSVRVDLSLDDLVDDLSADDLLLRRMNSLKSVNSKGGKHKTLYTIWLSLHCVHLKKQEKKTSNFGPRFAILWHS